LAFLISPSDQAMQFSPELKVVFHTGERGVAGDYKVDLSAITPLGYTLCRGKVSGLRSVQVGGIVLWTSKCVEVVGIRRTVDIPAVSSAIQMNKWFAQGAGLSARSAWGAARMLHRYRLLMSPDAACESIGSWMRYTLEPTPRCNCRGCCRLRLFRPGWCASHEGCTG
jgi:hypothetical protein